VGNPSLLDHDKVALLVEALVALGGVLKETSVSLEVALGLVALVLIRRVTVFLLRGVLWAGSDFHRLITTTGGEKGFRIGRIDQVAQLSNFPVAVQRLTRMSLILSWQWGSMTKILVS